MCTVIRDDFSVQSEQRLRLNYAYSGICPNAEPLVGAKHHTVYQSIFSTATIYDKILIPMSIVVK